MVVMSAASFRFMSDHPFISKSIGGWGVEKATKTRAAQAFLLLDPAPRGKMPSKEVSVMRDHDAVAIEDRPTAVRGRIDLDRYMGWGEKLFPDIDAQDYIRELRDCDREF